MAEPEPVRQNQPLHEPDVDKGGIGRSLRDIILGGQDGLVNVLGLVLGVAAATAQLRIILAAALAATFSESIAMGGVVYTATLAERDYYGAMLAKEQREVEELPDVETEEVRQIFRDKGLHGEVLERVVKEITSDKKVWVDTIMRGGAVCRRRLQGPDARRRLADQRPANDDHRHGLRRGGLRDRTPPPRQRRLTGVVASLGGRGSCLPACDVSPGVLLEAGWAAALSRRGARRSEPRSIHQGMGTR